MIHVFLGTKAQYIKTAPLLRLMDQRGEPYRLIDSGQHAALSVDLRTELGIRDPDVTLGDGRDVTTIPQALGWSARLAADLVRPTRLREEVFGGHGGICVVHGDTPSTLLSTLMARRAGLQVAHLEAGLRSGRLLDPFPEEAIRRIVMRLAHLLFAPDREAADNLAGMRLRGEVHLVAANTVVEAAAHALAGVDLAAVAGSGRAVVTMHRVENLKQAGRVRDLVDLVIEVARTGPHPVTFVTHGPTAQTLQAAGHLDRLRAAADGDGADGAALEVVDLLPHGEFIRLLAAAPWVITDGGSIQEECALLGVPTLLWRQRSERPDGLGANVVLGRHDVAAARRFVADAGSLRRAAAIPDAHPSEQVLDVLLAATRRGPARS